MLKGESEGEAKNGKGRQKGEEKDYGKLKEGTRTINGRGVKGLEYEIGEERRKEKKSY